MKMRLLVSIMLCLVVGVSAMAQNIVGKWKGEVKMTMPKQMQQNAPNRSMPKVDIEFKKDGTYISSQDAPNGQKRSSTGKWTLKGNVLTMTTTTVEGKPATGRMAEPRQMKVSVKGNTAVLDMSEMMRASMPKSNRAGGAGGPSPEMIKQMKLELVLKRG
jgi:hypothetical protein